MVGWSAGREGGTRREGWRRHSSNFISIARNTAAGRRGRGPILSALFECEFLEEGRKGDGTGWKEEREEGHYVHRKTEEVEVGSYACSSSRLILGKTCSGEREREREAPPEEEI